MSKNCIFYKRRFRYPRAYSIRKEAGYENANDKVNFWFAFVIPSFEVRICNLLIANKTPLLSCCFCWLGFSVPFFELWIPNIQHKLLFDKNSINKKGA